MQRIGAVFEANARRPLDMAVPWAAKVRPCCCTAPTGTGRGCARKRYAHRSRRLRMGTEASDTARE
ncbi:hypothetical protein ACPA9J_31400 [Pseudomonas aeruginosa]